MRLKRFDLTRYGKFTDKIIDFGDVKSGSPDFHIIYGSNEAGKSTLFSAFLDLVFGIGNQSSYNFIHPYNTMQIGGRIQIQGEEKEFIRLKRAGHSLFDAQNRPLPENAIRADIGTIERDSYRTMFSLDDETLEQGGENILASKGDLGELLFSASAGLSQLSNQLTDLRNEADQFYKFRGRNTQLQSLKLQLAELKAQREQLDIFAADYAQMIKIRDQSSAEYEQAQNERKHIRWRIDVLEKQLNALPRLAAWKHLNARFLPLSNLRQPPVEWVKEVAQLQPQEIELRVQLQSLNDEIARLDKEIKTIVLDENAMQLSAQLEKLEDARARYVTAAKDLPERRLELRELDASLAMILRRLGRENEKIPQNLVLSARVTGQFSVLIETRSGIDIALEAAQKEFINAEQQAKILKVQNQQIAENYADIDFQSAAIYELTELMGRLKTSEYHMRQQTAKEHLFNCQESLELKLRGLLPFMQDAQTLEQMQVPVSAQIQRWKTAITTAQKEIDKQKHDVERLSLHVAQLQSEKDALTLSQGLIDHTEAANIRQQREQAWALHRQQLDEFSANAFEGLLRQDDQVQENRISRLAELTKLQQLTYDLKRNTDELERAETILNAAELKLNALLAQVHHAVEQMCSSLVPHLNIDNLEDWLNRREQVLEMRVQMLTAEQKLNAALADEKQADISLKSALERAGIAAEKLKNLSLPALTALANHLLEYKAEWQKLKQSEIRAEEELQRRSEALEKAKIAVEQWDNQWQALCAQCWLSADGNVPELGVVREILPLIRELENFLEKKAALADRIDKMENDQKHFHIEMRNLSEEAGIADIDQDPLDLAHQLGLIGKTAIAAYERRLKLTQMQQDTEKKHRSILAKQAILLEHKAQKTQFFNVDSLEEVAEKLRQVQERAELERQIAETERDILAMLDAADVAAAEVQLTNIERYELETELVELRARSEDIDIRCQELYLAKNEADNQLAGVGGDDAVAKIEERRRTILLEIEDSARHYLQLRIGIAAAEQGLIAYRDKHRSSMMERASHAFSTMSRGDYLGLATQPGKDGEILIARAADGSSKEAPELSKGTRFQLYLALRIAGYYEFVGERPALPFIADDIMESFDDFRAEETLRLLAQMAEVGQVIYLTHHQHLCDIAKQVCPSVTLYNLS